VSDFCLGVALASWNAKRSPPPVAPTSGAFVSLSHIDRAGIRRSESCMPTQPVRL
jgi:hypothetical protein